MSVRNTPKNRLSGSRGKKNKGTPNDKTPSATITSFFQNTPPPKLACPLCGQLVPRYSINHHIDLQCENFERGGGGGGGDGGGDGDDDAAAALASSSLVPRQEEVSPKRNVVKSPAQESSSAPSQDDREAETSPYFKKHCTRRTTREKSNAASVVRKVDLGGGLSSKISRAQDNRDSRKTRDAQGLLLEKESNSELNGSQKENLCVDDNEDCLIIADLTPQVSRSEKNSKTSITNPPCSADEHIMEVNHGTSEAEAVHPMFSQRLSSPSSKLTKRKAKEPPGTSRDKMTASSKKAKCEGTSGESNKTPSSEERMDNVDTKDQTKEPSTAPCLRSDTQKVLETCVDASSDAAKRSEPSAEDPAMTSESTNRSRLPYYLRNFQTVLEAVLENEDDRELFNPEDLSSIHAFEKLSGILKYGVSF